MSTKNSKKLGGNSMMGYGHGMIGRGLFSGMGIMNGGGFSMILWVVVIIAVIYFFNNNYNSNKRHNRDNSSNYNNQHYNNKAEEIAKQRYANGEISKDELNEILVNIR